MTSFKNIIRTFGALVLVALLATACGGGSSEEDQAYVDALIASADENFPPGVDANCVAEGLVGALGGASGIRDKYNLEPEAFGGDIEVDMQEDDARKVVDEIWPCDGFKGSFYSEIAGPGAGDDTISCLEGIIDEGNVKTLLASGFMGDSGAELEAQVENDFEDQIFEAFTECDLGS